MIVGLLKSDMGFTYKQLVYDVSYQNLILLSSAIPSYDFDKKGDKKKNHKRINGNDPKNKALIDKELEMLG